jgi:outer membrane immunogenic protein
MIAMKTGAAALAVAAAFATSALAADLPARTAPPAAPVGYAPVFTWTGAYVGVNAGYGWGQVKGAGTYFDDPTGFVGGAQIGANYQMPNTNFVIGAEADIQYSGLEAKANGPGYAALGDAKQQVEWFGTVRPRVGFALDRTLLYVTGGLAYGNQKLSIPGYGSGTSTDIGWTAGAGAEYAFTNNVTAKLEGLYVDLGKSDLIPAAPVNKSGTEFGVVRAGLNYKF